MQMHTPLLSAAAGCVLLASCAVGPDYQRPREPLPQAFKETGPWKEAVPADLLARGDWWAVFDDPVLNQIEADAHRASPRLHAAMARVDQARAIAGIAQSYLYPTITVEATAGRFGVSGNRPDQPSKLPTNRDYETNAFRVPLYASYEIDVWGKLRRLNESALAQVEATLAGYQTVLLTLEADIAQTYFALRVTDEDLRILAANFDLQRRARDLVAARRQGGLASELDLARVETELASTEAQTQASVRRRMELEASLAVLVGKLPESFSVAAQPLSLKAPAVPAGLPSELLERRPDVAQAERLLAARNAEIGLAQAAWFPSIRLTGAVGFESNELNSLLDKESTILGITASLAQPIFDGGRISGNIERAKAAYLENLSNYRQQILVAFQEVDSTLGGLRVLSDQADAQSRAMVNAEKASVLATVRYRAGLVIVLEVIDAQRTSLQAQRQNLQILNQQLTTSVALAKALGGGWAEPRAPASSQQTASLRPQS
ncbi:MAG TPA: efflux transporter outer membrane subunit [Steroidobacteraceae bacterium]|nr:efflux transporter outer membrane subunit [Steroidobacteraceae bacterium]